MTTTSPTAPALCSAASASAAARARLRERVAALYGPQPTATAGTR
ncbi:hypothetical protein ACFFOM_00415 [Microlunatus capsulatus]|uniref:Uncharacterized protein n=1 Tax=Microlunatus capsulatus TaxID=99117 RepID=A0ABS4Z505_9ACTN|nr:hypothetical protein [Microlunatus capsulatus]MBP2415820.1 hypothetical protein [Microlunatus capsulatus]